MTAPQVAIPELCPGCRAHVVATARLTASDPYATTLLLAQLALFQACSRDRRVWERAGRPGETKVSDLTLVFAEIGCLGCFKPKTLTGFAELVLEHGFELVAAAIRETPMEDLDPPERRPAT